MASDVKIRFRSFLPGVGFDSSGNPKQGKTRVVGSIAVTSYEPGAEALAARDIGLTAIDSIMLRVADETGNASAQNNRAVRYVKSVGQFYLLNVASSGVPDEYAAAATETLEFEASGDSAHDVELV